jgi:tetratricopeptide (TPR) repeat protein
MPWRFLLPCVALLLLIRGDLSAQRRPESCERYEAAAHTDSVNPQAWLALGQCSYRDYEMIAPGGDSSRLAFRSSWTTSKRALLRAIALDPRYTRAYRTLFTILFLETRDGCSFETLVCTHVAPNLRDRDSILTVPRRVLINSQDPYRPVVEEAQASHQVNMAEARDIAARWATVAPNEWQPHEYLGRALLHLGDAAAAVPALERAAALGTVENRRELFWDRFEALVKADDGAGARRVLDEAFADPGRDTVRLHTLRMTALYALVGLVRRPPPPPRDTAFERLMQAKFDSMRRSLPSRTARLESPESEFRARLAARDTVGARRALTRADSLTAPYPGRMRIPQFNEEILHSAELHLEAADTAGAQERLDEVERVLMRGRPFQYNTALLGGAWTPWWGSAWLLSGDLAAARGRREEAARMYRRVVGLWGGGDDNLQSVVEQARTKLAALSVR